MYHSMVARGVRVMNDSIKKKFLFLLVSGLLIRMIGLGFVPPSMISDEILLGYDGACVYRTGMDHHGEHWPLFFKQSGEYRPPVYVYFAGLFSAPFGVNPYTVRLPSAVFGGLTIVLAFYFGRAFRDENFGMLLAALVAVSPWNLHYSRVGWEVISLVAVQLAALGLFFQWVKTPRAVYLLLSAFFFGMTIYTYPTSKLYTPLLMLALGGLYAKELWQHKKQCMYCFLLLILMMIPYWMVFSSTQAALEARWKFLSVFQYPNGLGMFFQHYCWHLLPGFLFISGDASPLHAMPSGVALLVLCPFFLAGLWLILKERQKPYLFLLFWFLTFPIPSSMTYDRFDIYCMPNALRSVAGMPVLEIISALGILSVLSLLKTEKLQKIGWYSVVTAIVINILVVGYLYAGKDRIESAPKWQWGIEELVKYTETNKAKYDKIVISHKAGLHPIHLALYSGREIKPFRGSDFPKYILPFFHYVPVYGDFGHQEYLKYGSIAKWYNLAPGKNLYISKPGEITGAPPVKTILCPDGSPAFELYETTR